VPYRFECAISEYTNHQVQTGGYLGSLPRAIGRLVDDSPFVVKLLTPLVLSFLSLAMTAGILWQQVEINLAILADMSEQTLVGNAKLFEIIDNFDTLNGQLYQHISQMLSNQEPADPKIIDAVSVELRATEEQLKSYERNYADAKTLRAVDGALEDLALYDKEIDFVRQMLEVDITSAASFIQPFDVSYRNVRSRLSLLLNDSVAQSQALVETRWLDAHHRRRQLLFWDISASLFLFGIGLVVIFVSRRSIRAIAVATREIADGRLSRDLTSLERRDELQSIVASLEVFQANRGELDRYRLELEALVTARTIALEKSNSELSTALDNLHEAQDELVEQGKLASLGSIVAGVAHEVNTPIGVCVTAASLLHERLNTLAELYEKGALKKRDIQEFVEDNTEIAKLLGVNLSRAADLIRSFKQIAADQTFDEAREVELGSYLSDIATNLKPELRRGGHKLEIETSEPMRLMLHPSALWQIMSNLIMNSLIHAFQEGEQGVLKIKLTQTRKYVRIIYSDNGKGMSEEVRRRIFEPFFTTKRGEGGTGLGMSIAYNLTKAMLNGTITCDSAPGRGATFTIDIPRQDIKSS
jgi:C4-dicarboxylate-specific signal transduction histidine kinase